MLPSFTAARIGGRISFGRRRGSALRALPFVNLSSDEENEYFADGLTEELITDLGQVPGYAGSVAQFRFSVQGEAVGCPQDRPGIACEHHSGGQRTEGRRPSAHHGATGERIGRVPGVVAALRPPDRRCVCHSGRNRFQHRIRAEGEAHGRGYGGNFATPPRGKPGGLLEKLRRLAEPIVEDPDYAPAWAGLADYRSGTSVEMSLPATGISLWITLLATGNDGG